MPATSSYAVDGAGNMAAQCETASSAVAWPAIIAGALTAAGVSLVLLLLGSGFGLAAVSPWINTGVSAVAFSATTAIWLIVMQWVSSALGGYLTGRLRCKWRGTQDDEVFFRDTAHGFLTWVLATLVTAAFLTSATTAIIGGTAKAATTMAAGAAAGGASHDSGQMTEGPAAYFVDSLFRADHVNPAASESDVRGEAAHILARGINSLSDADKNHLAVLVSARTGLAQPEAVQRVESVMAQVNASEAKLRQEADTARKTAATISIFTALSMLIGAFIASAAAALGGRHRDQ